MKQKRTIDLISDELLLDLNTIDINRGDESVLPILIHIMEYALKYDKKELFIKSLSKIDYYNFLKNNKNLIKLL